MDEIVVSIENLAPQVVSVKVDDVGFKGDKGDTDYSGLEALQAHIDSPTPHPAYDDGPSLYLLYENAKV